MQKGREMEGKAPTMAETGFNQENTQMPTKIALFY